LLADEVLERLGVTWDLMEEMLRDWHKNHIGHPKWHYVDDFIDGKLDRRNGLLKELRNIIRYLVDSRKEWEVIVGQVIAELDPEGTSDSPTSMYAFLGDEVCDALLR
jgi:hypothetical protein